MKKLLIGMLLITANADPRRDCTYIDNDDVTLLIITVNSYTMAEQYAKALVAIGCVSIELCPGFGNEGVGRIQKAVGPYVPVGVVRFDLYPPCGTHSVDLDQKK